ncbi:MAG: hypothetical protein P0Y53_15560 [Candidatus Pseudobacter hemicellulosilyticus]|uniref:Uncharacterized protein n=1 Tax=Candidatus Pseudobacter hemicellulosilyticus TaxID=3121375 RepID=A0AAJ6BDR0_9BACT|nr:MAG: hypothetical protein P0Y53_15560 [Pseudobacter sp.]
MKAYLLAILLLSTAAAHAQTSLNNYKYVIVPEKFSFAREEDQYGLNTLTRQLLEEKGFVAYLDNGQLPVELAGNKCNALLAEVVQKKSLMVTNLTLQLKDCQGNILFKSKEGKSREKEYFPAFTLALRDAFTSLKDVPYQYDGTVFATAQPVRTAPAAPATDNTPVPATTPAPAATPASTGTPAPAPAGVKPSEISGVLYAQATENGFQLVDTSPKKVLTLLKTSVPDHFIAEAAGRAGGLVFKKNSEWIFEYYKDNKLVSQKLDIKF